MFFQGNNFVNGFRDIKMYRVKKVFLINISLALIFITGFSANACNFSVKVEQFLRNEGFHRNITYSITFDNTEDGWMHQDCILALYQTLPSGVYANPDELGDLRRLQKLNAIPTNRINVELPAEQSEPSAVYIVTVVTEDMVEVWLPVHARYHMAVPGGGTYRNEIEAPKLYLRCPDQRLDTCDIPATPAMKFLCNGSSKEKCSWTEIPFTIMTDTLIWHVPVGNTDHYYMVALGTAIVGVVGSLYLLKMIHEYKVAAKRKRL